MVSWIKSHDSSETFHCYLHEKCMIADDLPSAAVFVYFSCLVFGTHSARLVQKARETQFIRQSNCGEFGGLNFMDPEKQVCFMVSGKIVTRSGDSWAVLVQKKGQKVKCLFRVTYSGAKFRVTQNFQTIFFQSCVLQKMGRIEDWRL